MPRPQSPLDISHLRAYRPDLNILDLRIGQDDLTIGRSTDVKELLVQCKSLSSIGTVGHREAGNGGAGRVQFMISEVIIPSRNGPRITRTVEAMMRIPGSSILTAASPASISARWLRLSRRTSA